LHNMREEMEHASMLIEWIRRRNEDFAGFLRTYLFTEGSILEIEHEQGDVDGNGGGNGGGNGRGGGGSRPRRNDLGTTVGSLKGRR